MAIVLAISGSVDVDSAIITRGSLPKGTLAPQVAGLVIGLPIILNSLVKAVLALSIAEWQQGKPAALVLFATAIFITLAGAALFLLR